jgi:hypothetical protein
MRDVSLEALAVAQDKRLILMRWGGGKCFAERLSMRG